MLFPPLEELSSLELQEVKAAKVRIESTEKANFAIVITVVFVLNSMIAQRTTGMGRNEK